MTHTRESAPMPQGKVTAILVFTTVLWGGSFLFNKIGMREIPPIQFFFFRFALAALLMGIICIPRLSRLNRDIVRRGAMVGVALAAVNLTFVLGVSGTTISRAGYLNNLFVLFIPLISFLIWRERLDRITFAGVFLAVAGLWELASGGAEGFNRGDLLSTVCAVFIAIHIITVSRVLRDEDVYLVTFVQFSTVALAGAAITLAMPWPAFTIGAAGGWSLAYCAIFPTVICFTLQNAFQRFTTPTKAGLIYTLDPVWSMLAGVFILGERLTPRELVGCMLILVAVAGPLLGRLYLEQRHRRLYHLDDVEEA
ncbi:membrane protein, putative [Geobacter metallireducens GS-15]|uniref:Membrane protein, putative n=1 Tax=Geobacter metallireducens (strain ATCC 53774 / DSM 7210 / GS-15) TaxID=269799 RepID=Q39RD2_GEOMG|nr:DMT family transporter [Geobacter metallireducens]ABB33192.1 membrane protein, putative [Geobacter metallireducens GS-15]